MSATSITSLPVEILVSIACEVQPQDLKNFVLTCRVVFSASQDALTEYRELRKQDRHVGNFKREQRSSACHYLAELLHRILESPKVASHVEHFSYREDEHDEYRAADYRQSFQDNLEKLQLNNPERQTWWFDTKRNRYKPRAHQLMVGLLVHHLPNLEAFEWHSVRFSRELINLLQPTQLHQAGLRAPLLHSLKKVSLGAGQYGMYVGQITLKQVLPFLALPNIECMRLHDLRYSDPPDHLDAAAVPSRSSNLRDLVIMQSHIDKVLHHLLQLPRSLRKLEFVTPWTFYEPSTFRVFPLRHAHHYDLEHLCIRMTEWRDHIDREALPEHTKLKFLETDCFLTDDATITPASKIKHYFPPSVRHIVFADTDMERPKDFFIYLQQILELRKAKIIPNLRHLTLRSEAIRIMKHSRKIKAVRRKCKALGIELVIDLEDPGWRTSCNSFDQVSWWRRSHDGYSSADIDRVCDRETRSEDV